MTPHHPHTEATVGSPADRVALEACVETLGEALAAQRAGAARVELCAGLVEGGTTAGAGTMAAVLDRLTIPVFVMVRPRGGDFLYDADDLAVMLQDIAAAKRAGAHGIASGALAPDGTIAEEQVRRLRDAAGSLPFTFHRAFDCTRDLERSLDALLRLGVDRVLTSGGAPTALAGADRIASWCRAGDGWWSWPEGRARPAWRRSCGARACAGARPARSA